jgi:hypothetical protein
MEVGHTANGEYAKDRLQKKMAGAVNVYSVPAFLCSFYPSMEASEQKQSGSVGASQ